MSRFARIVLLIVLVFALAACGGDDDDGSKDSGNTNIEVTGALDFKLDGSAQVSITETAFDEGNPVWQVQFAKDNRMVVVMFYSGEPEAGEYAITPDGPLTGDLGVLVSDNSGDSAQMFALDGEGTITIDEAGDTFGGSFEFVVHNQESTETVNVKGTFSGVD